jgi:hypothetical protein
MEDSCIKVFSSAHKQGVSVGTVFHIIHKKITHIYSKFLLGTQNANSSS